MINVRCSYKQLIQFSFLIFLFTSCATRHKERTSETKKESLSNGIGEFVFTDYKPFAQKPMKVFYYKPEKFHKDTEIMILMHGNSRAAKSYRNSMATYAEKNNFLLIVPEFSKENFPKSLDYHQGGVFDKEGHVKNSTDWAFSIIEPLFDYVKDMTDNDSEGYVLYGFSAGSQFVHRFTWFYPDNRAIQTIAASAGSYTMPNYDNEYYFGLKNVKTQVPERNIKRALGKNLTIAVGDADTIRGRSDLPKSLLADAQGKTRVERARNFYQNSAEVAEKYGVPFNWKLILVKGVGHKQGEMAEPISEMLDFVK